MDRLRAAEVFAEIVGRGSLSAAAERLGMSRAMVTRYLAEMETWAGARLLHRTTRRLSLTPSGEQALARCQQMLALAAEVPTPAEDVEGPRGLLRIACSQSLAQDVLMPVVSAFLRRFPLVAVDFRIDARPVNLVEERIDLAIRITNDLDPNLIARRLGVCDSVVCAAPAYLEAHGVPRRPEDLATHNCLTYSLFGRSLWLFHDTADEPVSVPVAGNLSANESHVLLAAAEAGAGVALQPAYAVTAAVASGRLVPLLTGYRPQALGIHAIYASRRHMSPALRTLLDVLSAHFQDPARWPPMLAAPAGKPA